MSRRAVIELEDIYKRFYIGTPNELTVLNGINLTIYEGEFVAVVGASGSGKSTLMNIIGALDRPTQGQYHLDGVDMVAARDRELSGIRNRKIGFVFQTYNLIAKTNALKNVEMPMLYGGVTGRKRVERARGLQKKRFRGTGIRHNSVIPGSEIRRYCPLGSAEEAFLRKAFRVMDISARAYHRIIRVARTIADLEGGEEIRTEHLQEAVAYRMENIYY